MSNIRAKLSWWNVSGPFIHNCISSYLMTLLSFMLIQKVSIDTQKIFIHTQIHYSFCEFDIKHFRFRLVRKKTLPHTSQKEWTSVYKFQKNVAIVWGFKSISKYPKGANWPSWLPPDKKCNNWTNCSCNQTKIYLCRLRYSFMEIQRIPHFLTQIPKLRPVFLFLFFFLNHFFFFFIGIFRGLTTIS